MEDALSVLRSSGRHWFLFYLLVLIAYLAAVAVKNQWAGPAGYVAVPALIGYFIVRKGAASGNLTVSYAIFAILLSLLVGGEVVRASGDAAASINDGCLNRNPWVAQLQSEEDQKLFCGCVAEKMKWPLMRKLALAYLTFRELTPVKDDPALVRISLEGANQCAAELPAR